MDTLTQVSSPTATFPSPQLVHCCHLLCEGVAQEEEPEMWCSCQQWYGSQGRKGCGGRELLSTVHYAAHCHQEARHGEGVLCVYRDVLRQMMERWSRYTKLHFVFKAAPPPWDAELNWLFPFSTLHTQQYHYFLYIFLLLAVTQKKADCSIYVSSYFLSQLSI